MAKLVSTSRGSLSPELRALVDRSVTLLGQVVRERLGERSYARIEVTRARLTKLRGAPRERAVKELRLIERELARLSREDRLNFARAFALMLELMNACENAYRNAKLARREGTALSAGPRPDTIIYVLTAHPTEARAPGNIWVFHELERVLTKALLRPVDLGIQSELMHWVELAWLVPPVRRRKPRVLDEAEHIYTTLLRDETLRALLAASRDLAPVYVRSWVGGDKDGHPGVDERAFIGSLQRSRSLLLAFIERRLGEALPALDALASRAVEARLRETQKAVSATRRVRAGDGARVLKLRAAIHGLIEEYGRVAGAVHPGLGELLQLGRVFPAFVVPLEFRESSDLIMSAAKSATSGRPPAIVRMLAALGRVSQASGSASSVDPRWYVRGLIISMAESIEHVRAAALLVTRALGGGVRLPIIPLFEQEAALENGARIAGEMLEDGKLRRALRESWGGHLEVMLGYSDSAKESGVLPSRLAIAEGMHAIDRRVSRERGVRPIFFQGSGGSVDRGGGTIPEQTAWWSPSALRNFKVTLQGEVVERSFASPEILRGQLERVAASAGRWPKVRIGRKTSPGLERFATRVAEMYRASIAAPDFLEVVERATPYRSLDALKIGSRPSKRAGRAGTLSVGSLRAIPWVLCWTQTRVLFPTWWGVGTAWREASPAERASLKRAYRQDPVFATYVRALGFTLSKVELPVWRIYLEQSRLAPECVEANWDSFTRELKAAHEFAHAILGRDLLGWRPWLAESIRLRSPMIHPLNLLQTIAIRERDSELLRITTLGISSGMMTTG